MPPKHYRRWSSSSSARATMRIGESPASCTASFRITAVGAFSSPRVLGPHSRAACRQKRGILRCGPRQYRDFSGLNVRAQVVAGKPSGLPSVSRLRAEGKITADITSVWVGWRVRRLRLNDGRAMCSYCCGNCHRISYGSPAQRSAARALRKNELRGGNRYAQAKWHRFAQPQFSLDV